MTSEGRESPLKVLHYYPTNYGMTGVESFILQLVTAQKRAGLAPQIMIDIAGREELVNSVGQIGVRVTDFPKPVASTLPGIRQLARVLTGWSRVRALRRQLKGCDVLHLHSAGFTGLDALLAARLAGTRTVIVTHHMTVAIYRKYWKRLGTITLWLQKRVAAASVMPYEEAARELVEVGLAPERVRVVPYCIDEVRFAGRNTPPAGDERLRLIIVARLHTGKGHDVLLDALASLKQKGRAVRLTIVGGGDTRPAIENKIETLGLQSMVDPIEYVDHSAIPALLRQAHVIVLPSFMDGETFPLSLLEGALMGLPAIGSRWFGIPSIIKDGETGFVVAPRSSTELADAIEKLAVDRELYGRMSEQAHTRAQTFFTGKAVAATYTGLYLGRPALQ